MVRLIQTKFVIALLVVLALGLGLMFATIQRAWQGNVERVSRQALTATRAALGSVERADLRLLATVAATVATTPDLVSAATTTDREQLARRLPALLVTLRERSPVAALWLIRPDGAVLACAPDPTCTGDLVDDPLLAEARRTGAPGLSGIDDGRSTLRAIHPMRGASGEIAGYVMLAETVAGLATSIQETTGYDTAIVFRHRPDAGAPPPPPAGWPQGTTAVLAAASKGMRPFAIDEALTPLPETGRVLDRLEADGRVLVRGAVPIRQRDGEQVGAVYMLGDITEVYVGMVGARLRVMGASLVLALGLIAVTLILLRRLIFARLNRVIDAATRLAGGATDQAVAIARDDEVGKLEALFEQFRVLFTSTVSDLEEQLRRH